VTKAAGSAGTASDGFRVPETVGRHRAPPPVPAPRAPTVIAAAAAVLTVASVVAIAVNVAPDARAARSPVAPTARETPTVLTAGPLEVPSIGVVAPAVESLYSTPSAPPQHIATVPRGVRTSQTAPKARSEALVAITTPSQPTVTPAPQPVTRTTAATTTETTPAAPPTDVAAATDQQQRDDPGDDAVSVTVDRPCRSDREPRVVAEVTP
jgi:hypothetical protein